MMSNRKYQVMLLPDMEVIEEGLSLEEADAWQGAYNSVIHGDPHTAVIAERGGEMGIHA